SRPGELVTRDELRAQLWSADTFVDFEHGLNKAINKIREALGDSAESPRFVETVPRRGYRFIADVALAGVEPVSLDADAPTTSAGPPNADGSESTEPARTIPLGGRGWQRTLTLAGFLLALVSGVLAGWVFRVRREWPTVRSLAVLPLENLSGDPSQEYFADGMTDQLIA